MKRVLFYLIIIFIVFISYSCNNNFDPNAPFRERYVLNGIIRSDTSLQVITITHTYRPPESDPNSYTDSPYIEGAEVNMWYKYKLYELRDTVLQRNDTSRYKGPVHCYYVNNLRPEPNEYVDIEALLPNGLLLQSTTKTPDADSLNFFNYSDDKIIPPQKGNVLNITWEPLNNVLFDPKIEILYYKSGDTNPHFKEVPLLYYNDNGTETPVFPKASTTSVITLDMSTVATALKEISEGDASKSNYSIVEMEVVVITYDQALATYYSSIQPPSNNFTVTLDEPDYSNIQGGYGIFGSYVKRIHRLTFTSDYLQQFGYH